MSQIVVVRQRNRQIVAVRRPAKRVVGYIKQKRTVAIRQPGPRGTQGRQGDRGETGPPSIYVGEEPPPDHDLNPLWLDIS